MVPKIDTLLEPLMLAASAEQVDESLTRIVQSHVEPIIKGIIRYKLHLRSQDAWQQAEADDLYQESIAQLLEALRQLKERPESHPIADLRGFAAVIAHRTCSRWMRRQFPERHAVKTRLHYLLTRHRSFALWQDRSARWTAGFTAWRGQEAVADAAQLERVSDHPQVLSEIESLKANKARGGLPAVLAAVFNCVGGPVELDDLVALLGSLLKIRDQPVRSLDDSGHNIRFTPATEPDVAWQVEKRIFLQRLWEELRQLPKNQRAALLLNLKDAEGGSCIALFPVTGVATLHQLAEVLEISADRFAVLWNELPLEDSKIAELLGLTRQQVINARKSGRERLTRRLKGFI
jgi:RNA polymerase sigma factor (sigma-70 family)